MGKVILHPANQANLASLWQQIMDKHLQPEDDLEVAALLESFGWTDERVRQQFGVQDVFELATDLRRMNRPSVDLVANEYVAAEPLRHVVGQMIRQFVRGIVFALPMVLSIAAMLVLRFSLWSYQYLSTRSATAIAIGTILSFLTVGGFMQAMARQGYFYMFQGYYKMMQRMTFRLIALGLASALLISVTIIGLDIVFPELPMDMLILAIAYYLVLTSIWLAVAVLYIIGREIVFTGILSVGVLLVFVGFRLLHINILVAQLISMVVVAVLSIVLLQRFFQKDQQDKDNGVNPPLPRIGVTMYSVAPYFFYGMLYFALLFCDRVMAWSTHSAVVPFIIWFRGDYELGLDFALVTLIVPMGFSEIVVTRLMTRMWRSQRNFMADRHQELNDAFARQYRRQVLLMAAVSTGAAISVYDLARFLLKTYMKTLPGHIEMTPISLYVFLVALASYTILAVGLLHAVVMFSLSRPELVLRPILLSVAVNFVVGFLLTRWIGYPQAVWGLFAGALIFTTITSRNVGRVLKSLDYHMYLLS